MEKNLKENQEIILSKISADKYGKRIVAEITTTNGVNLGKNITAQELAQSYNKRQKDYWCEKKHIIK